MNQTLKENLTKIPVITYDDFVIFKETEGRYYMKNEDHDFTPLFLVHTTKLTESESIDELLNTNFDYDVSGEFDNIIDGYIVYAYFKYDDVGVYCSKCKKDILPSDMSHSVITKENGDTIVYDPINYCDAIDIMLDIMDENPEQITEVSGGYCPYCLNCLE